MEAGDGADGCWIEGCPRSDLANVPPEVLGVCVADVDIDLAYQSWCWVGRSEVCHHGRIVAIINGAQCHLVETDGVLEWRWSALRDIECLLVERLCLAVGG